MILMIFFNDFMNIQDIHCLVNQSQRAKNTIHW